MIRILYLDDRLGDRSQVLAVLDHEICCFQVIEAASRLDFNTHITQSRFDLLLADPLTGGFERLEMLDLAWSIDPCIPVLLLSSSAAMDMAVDAMKMGAADFLMKSPEQLQKLPGVINSVLEKRRKTNIELRRQLQELTLLHKIAMAASAANSEDSLIVEATRIIHETFQITNLTFALVDEKAELLRRHPSFEFLDGWKDYTLPLGEGITGWVALHGESWYVPDVRIEPNYRVMHSETCSELCVAMKTGTRVIGVINVERDQVDAFSELDERLFVTLAGQLATAIERVRLFQQSQEQARELAGLYNTALAISSVLDANELLKRIYEQVQQLINPDSFGIVLYDERSHEFRVALGMEQGQSVSDWKDQSISPQDGGLTGWVIESRQTLLIDDMETDELPAIPIHSTRPARSWLGAPLLARDQIVGVISVQSFRPHGFNQTHKRFLESLAGQVAIALENARLFYETRQRLSELEALNKITSSIRTAQTLGEMLSSLIDETLSVLEAQAGAIWLHDPANDELWRAVARGWFENLPEVSARRGTNPAWKVLETQETHHFQEFASDTSFTGPSNERVPAGWGGVCVPLRAAQDTVGVFFASVPLPRQLTSEEIHLLTMLSEITGNAIYRMRLHEQTERRLQHLGALHLVDMAISSSVDLRITMNILLEQVTTQLRVDAADIMLYSSYLQTLEYAVGRGFRSKPAESVKLRLGEGYAGRAALEHRIIAMTRLNKTGQTAPLPGLWAGEHFVTYFAVPLIAKGQLKGVLNIYHRAVLDPDSEWMNFLETLSTQAAIAIDNTTLFDNLQRANVELALAYDATIEGWSLALDIRDHETEGHTQRVVEMTMRLAGAMGIKDNELVHIRRGALLHDIGKMGISDTILLKPGKPTSAEWEIIRKHPVYAYDLLSPIFYLVPALDIPYCHHEKWDGSGYPRGLAGERIPLAARIFAVADVWDALTTERCYHKPWFKASARQYILEQAGKHFDPKVVEVFLRLQGSDLLPGIP
jgi:response regulator RpfG family c-di-GMP phosphodiesterase/putative methionine-R-sulfoxide reductase with GAF domain